MAYCRGEVYMYRWGTRFVVHLGHELQTEELNETYIFDSREEVLEFLSQSKLKDYTKDAIVRLQREIGETNATSTSTPTNKS